MEFFFNILAMPFWSKFTNFHGFLAMVSLFLFGISFILYFQIEKAAFAISWLKNSLLILFFDLLLLDIAGLSIYAPYRAKGGPRSLLLGSEDTAWLHQIIFEHKEFLAFAPPILIITAFLVIKALGNNIKDKENMYLKRAVFVLIISALLIVLTVAAEAVLVAKAAPL